MTRPAKTCGSTKKATRRQIDAARLTLLIVTETEDLSGEDRDALALVRHRLDDILDARWRQQAGLGA